MADALGNAGNDAIKDAEISELNALLPEGAKEAGEESYGAKVFSGQFGGDMRVGVHDGYLVAKGDKLRVSIWGSVTLDQSMTVDNKGNIVLPEVGPVRVAGTPYGQLNEKLRRSLEAVYKEGIGSYVDVVGTKPIAAFVTGEVAYPGRYDGAASDSLLHFIDKAGGVDKRRGSYRHIELRRKGTVLATIDLYAFLLEGKLPDISIQDGDTIFVRPRGTAVAAEGMVNRPQRFEFTKNGVSGADLEALAMPETTATHVSVVGVRRKEPFSAYMTRRDFADFSLREGDRVYFHNAMEAQSIRIFVEGAFRGPKMLVAPVGTRLTAALQQLEMRPGVTDLRGVSIDRPSVAKRQEVALEDALRRLQQSVAYGSTTSAEESRLRGEEMTMIKNFVAGARQVKPTGKIVVSRNGAPEDVMLEDGDKIIVPSVSNIVFVNGEVAMPQAIVEKKGTGYEDYIAGAGGYGPRADKRKALVRKMNGEVIEAKGARIEGGDEIIVLPKVYANNLQFAKDITDVLYKIAIAAAVPIRFLDN
ncbi:MAG: polysaccharide biosynthesis/export family protein [Rickettsiales bacterium]